MASRCGRTLVSIWIGIAISALGLMFVVFGALLRLLSKSIKRQVEVDDKIDGLVEDVERLVIDKDKVHMSMFEQMKSDRDATDKRLRYLEEFWMSAGRRVIKALERD